MPGEDFNNILTKGYKSALATTAIEDGKLRFTTDTGELYLDEVSGETSQRVKISDIIDTYTEAELANILAPLPKIYLTTDTHRMYVNVSGTWYDISDIDLSIVAGTEDAEEVVWFSPTNDANPKYDSGLSYNPKKKILTTPKSKIGDMLVYTETDTVSGDVTAHFEIPDPPAAQE